MLLALADVGGRCSGTSKSIILVSEPLPGLALHVPWNWKFYLNIFRDMPDYGQRWLTSSLKISLDLQCSELGSLVVDKGREEHTSVHSSLRWIVVVWRCSRSWCEPWLFRRAEFPALSLELRLLQHPWVYDENNELLMQSLHSKKLVLVNTERPNSKKTRL